MSEEAPDMTDGTTGPSIGGLMVRRPTALDEPVLALLRATTSA